MHKLAVVGNPIAHSLSPVIFNLFAKECSIVLEYSKIFSKDEASFKQQVQQFFANGGLALNITSPFKQEAYKVAAMPTIRAKFCQAANFLRLDSQQHLVADTTDGIGLVADLQLHKQITLMNKKILIIGSGFVLDSILIDFIIQNPQRIDVLARNHGRIKYLGKKFATGVYTHAMNYDIIINSSPNIAENELFGQINTLLDESICYDLAYSNSATLFLQRMQALNPRIITYNGLGMLVEQAKIAFVTLFAKVPNTRNVLTELTRIKDSA